MKDSPKMQRKVEHIYKIPKSEFMMRIGIGNKYNGLSYSVDGYDDDKNIIITVQVPALNKNGNYQKQI